MPARRSKMSRYPWWWLTSLASRIEHRQRREAHSDLNRLLARFDREHTTALAPRKLRCAALMSHCLRGAYRGGADSETVLDEFMRGLDRLATLRSWEDVKRFIRRHVDALIGHVHAEQAAPDVERLIREIRQEMSRAPDRVRSLKEYAAESGFNADYLSRCFFRFAGVSFREERKRSQIEFAKRMLETRSLKIRVVADRAGFKDAGRFARYLEAVTGMKPVEYRARHARSDRNA